MKYILIILSTLFIFSCSEKSQIPSDPLAFISDTTTISIDRSTEPITRSIQYLNGELYWWNSDRETIGVFDLNTKSLKNTIKIERDGPNGLGNPLGFFVHDSDSIYIPTMSFELSLINSKGEWIADYDYFRHSLMGDIAGSITRYSNMIQTNNKQLLFLNIPDLSHIQPADLNAQSLVKYPPILSFNKSTGEFEYLKFKVPSSVLKINDFIRFSKTASSESLILLHEKSNILFVLDFNGLDFKEYLLQSDLIKAFSNQYYHSSRMSSSVNENMRLAFKSSENFGLAFDIRKNLLYRFGWPGEEIPIEEDPMQFNVTPPYFTISVYDGTEFTLLKEFTLPRNTYLAHHYFVDEKGLNLFPMHPENPEFNEDLMVIHTFDFSRLK
jgi:hypothetical protein